MPSFAYKAIDHNGEVVKGFIEGNHIDHVYESVSSTGLNIVNIRQSSSLHDLYAKRIRVWGIKQNDIIEFATNLSVMVKAGIPLVTSISDMAESSDNKGFKARLMDIHRSVELGSGFSGALSQHKDIFPEVFINLVAVGEETGRLDRSLSDIAVHLQRMEDLRSAIIRAIIYPAFALISTSGALLFWLIYVLPKMAGVFDSMSVDLPLATQMLMIASSFSSTYWYVYFLAPLSVYAIVKLLSRKEWTKYYIDSIKLRLPVVKLILHNKLLALFAEQFRILTNAGVTIDKSFDIMTKVVNNVVFKRSLVQARDEILLGSKMSDALKKHCTLFPNLALRMILIGESTGNMSEPLDYLSEYYLKKLDDISQKMSKLIEPLVIIVVGGIFMVIILGLLSPLYDLITGLGN